MTEDAAAEDVPPVKPWIATLAALPIGAVAAIAGLAPWLLTGAHLPKQSLWNSSVIHTPVPVVLIPFSQDGMIEVFSCLVVGAALAGIAGRALRTRGWALSLLVLGVLAVQVTATVQTTIVLREGLQDRFESAVYLAGLLAGATLSILVGVVVTVLVAAAPRAGALLGLTVGAIGTTAWVGSQEAIVAWVAPALVGIAIAWTGVNTVGRIIAVPFSLAIMWIAPSAMTAVADTLGGRVQLDSADEIIGFGADVFESTLLAPGFSLRPVVTAVVVAALGLGVRSLVRWRRAATGEVETAVAPALSEPWSRKDA